MSFRRQLKGECGAVPVALRIERKITTHEFGHLFRNPETQTGTPKIAAYRLISLIKGTE